MSKLPDQTEAQIRTDLKPNLINIYDLHMYSVEILWLGKEKLSCHIVVATSLTQL